MKQDYVYAIEIVYVIYPQVTLAEAHGDLFEREIHHSSGTLSSGI